MSPKLIPILNNIRRSTGTPSFLWAITACTTSTLDRIDHRGELKQHAVPRGLDETIPMLCHESIGDLAVFAENAGGADLIEAHEPRVARHVSRDYRRQPSSDPSWLLLLHAKHAPLA